MDGAEAPGAVTGEREPEPAGSGWVPRRGIDRRGSPKEPRRAAGELAGARRGRRVTLDPPVIAGSRVISNRRSPVRSTSTTDLLDELQPLADHARGVGTPAMGGERRRRGRSPGGATGRRGQVGSGMVRRMSPGRFDAIPGVRVALVWGLRAAIDTWPAFGIGSPWRAPVIIGYAESLVSHIFRTTPATIGSQRGPVATAS